MLGLLQLFFLIEYESFLVKKYILRIEKQFSCEKKKHFFFFASLRQFYNAVYLNKKKKNEHFEIPICPIKVGLKGI